MAQSVMEGFINTYQKSFGMTFISDDFFFAYVGLAFNLLIGFSSLIWGYLYDLKGFKVISEPDVVIFIKKSNYETLSFLVQCSIDWVYNNVPYINTLASLCNTQHV